MSTLSDGALAAAAFLRIETARRYGLVEGGPEINVERCEEVIAEARAAGIVHTEDEIDAALVAFLATSAGEQR